MDWLGGKHAGCSWPSLSAMQRLRSAALRSVSIRLSDRSSEWYALDVVEHLYTCEAAHR